jgi:hypothetical protein
MEIRKEIREHILREVNESLARLGISEPLVEREEYKGKDGTVQHYNSTTAPIKQMPKMFKQLFVVGQMEAYEGKDPKRVEVRVRLDYAYNHYNSGSNGCGLGIVYFNVEKDLPKEIKPENTWWYVSRTRGLEI